MKMESQHTKIYRCSKSRSKKEVYSDKHIYQEKRKISNKQPKFTPQGTSKIRTN